MNRDIPFVSTVGSMWFAAVVLVLLLVAMASATVFESSYGPERALSVFYNTWWFEGLLGLLAVNVLAAMVGRFPFSRRQIGFVVTHASILTVFAGALVTKHFGVDGQVAIAEGRTLEEFTVFGRPTLMLTSRRAEARAAVDLDPSVFGGFEAVGSPAAEPLVLGDLRVEVLQYLPDSRSSLRVVDDNPRRRPAVEVAFWEAAGTDAEADAAAEKDSEAAPGGAASSEAGEDERGWVFAGQNASVGPARVAFRLVQNPQELLALLSATSSEPSGSKGTVKIAYEGKTYAIPLEQCMDAAAAVGETGYSVRVARYLPHMQVVDGEIVNVSPQPQNPYIEAELTDPAGKTEQHRAYAKFPDFDAMHGGSGSSALKVSFSAAAATAPAAPVEVLGDPDGRLYARFTSVGRISVSEALVLDRPVETPWPGRRFAVLQRLEHARWDRTVVPVEPVRKEGREPALLVALNTAEHSSEMWVQRGRGYSVSSDGVPHEIAFGAKSMPLGFSLTLDRFHMRKYPGMSRPRTFESHVKISDPSSGHERSGVISMNNPLTYGGYTFYQSSYDQRDPTKTVSVLSVSRDPGQPIVFAGYIAMMAGMVWVLVLRMQDRRRLSAASAAGGGIPSPDWLKPVKRAASPPNRAVGTGQGIRPTASKSGSQPG